MNQRMLAKIIGQLFMAPDPGNGGTGGGGTGTEPPAVKPEDARAFVADFVQPDALKAMKDEDVVKEYARYNTVVEKHTKAHGEKSKAAALEAAKALKLDLPKDTKLHATDAESVLAYARKHGLSADQAKEALLQRNEAIEGYVKRQGEQAKAKQDEWVKTVSADPDLGGAKLTETQKQAQLAIDKFMPQPLRDMLRESGLGDHPEVIRFLRNVGATLKEDSAPNNGSGGGKGEVSLADKMYPSTAGQ